MLSSAATSRIKPEPLVAGVAGRQSKVYLRPDVLQRLCVSLIRAEQDRMLRAGAIHPGKMDALHNRGLHRDDIDAVAVDLEMLGFDSLALLELIMKLNVFFGLHRTGIEDYLLVKRRIGDWVNLLSAHFALAPVDLSMTFTTSGSGGHPKNIFHRLDRMHIEVRALLDGPLSHFPAHGRIIALVPPHHIYGFLFTALLPSMHGVEVIDLCAAGPGAPARVARPGDLIVGTPLNWRYLVELQACFVEGVHGVVSAGPSDRETWSVLEDCGLTTLTEVYGSTETLGVATRSTQHSTFTLMPHLTRDGNDIADLNGVLELQDRLIWKGPRDFVLAGRLDNVVQVGGSNVNLSFVRQCVLEVAGVDDAVIRCDRSRLKAFVQTALTNDARLALDLRIRQALQCQLPAPAVPQSIIYGPDLPRNPMGKLCDWQSQ